VIQNLRGQKKTSKLERASDLDSGLSVFFTTVDAEVSQRAQLSLKAQFHDLFFCASAPLR
jgi:hypothetical protein